MKHEKFIELKGQPGMVKLDAIPVLHYAGFCVLISELLREKSNHCLNYFVVPYPGKYKFICCIGSDEKKSVLVFSHEQDKAETISLPSLARMHFPFHIF